MLRRALAFASALGVASALLGVPASFPATAAPQPVTPNAAKTGRPGPVFTLLTGDKVRLDKAADGSQTGVVVYDAGPQDDVVFQQVNDSLYALTGQAIRLVGTGRVDRELFNLTKLAEYNYDDVHTKHLHLITTYNQSNTSRVAIPAPPKGASRKRTLAPIGGQALAVDKKQTARTWAELTRAGSPAAKIWLDGKVKASLDVSVPTTGAPAVWSAGHTGKGVKVAVLDTGIDTRHPDFAGRIVAKRRFVPGDPANAEDGYGHGTHVASIAAGSGAASGGKYRGMAPDAQLVVGKVLDDNGYGLDSEIIAGMEWAADQGAKVINMSLGGDITDGTDPIAQALNRISDSSGALFAVAAGNAYHQNPWRVESPGSADRALTVGATGKRPTDALADFSSGGPRLGDRGVKPEIVAPGKGIVAAKGRGSKDIGEHNPGLIDGYMQLSGTSMATPHVAGGAVLLASQHPDWSRDQIRDALVSTADPLDNTPVTNQGAGRLDLKQAGKAGLVATGTINIGMIKHPQPATTQGTVTLRNTGDQPVQADLGLKLFKMDKMMMAQTTFTPGDAVTVSPSKVQVAAGGTATVTVTVNNTALEYGSYYGYVEAKAGETVTRATLGWTKDYPRARLTVRGTDRAGNPAHTTGCSRVSLMDLESGEVLPGWWEQGVAHFWPEGPDPMLPKGRYALIGNICDYTAQEPYWKMAETVGGDPELVLDRDRQVVIDARQGKKVEYRTHRPAERPNHYPNMLSWRRIVRGAQDVNWVAGETSDGQSWYVIPSSSKATNGTFELRYANTVVEPALTMRTAGKDGTELHPFYPLILDSRPTTGTGCRLYGVCVPPFRSPGKYELADGGTGSPAELAAAGVGGKVAVVREVWQVPCGGCRPPKVDQVTANAAAAGAAGVLIVAAHPGQPNRVVEKNTAVPVAVLRQEEGKQLASVMHAGPVTISTGGAPDASYAYYLNYTTDHLPAKPVYMADRKHLATVRARYHADVPGAFIQTESYEETFVGPRTRTEYRSPGTHRISVFYNDPVNRWLLSGIEKYAAGTRVTQDYNSTPITPGPYPEDSALTAHKGTSEWDQSYMGIGIDPFRIGTYSEDLNVAETRVRVLRDGKVLCETPYISGCYTEPQAGRYRLEVDTKQQERPVSVATRTAWEFSAAFDKDNEILPMLNLGYDVPVDLTNAVKAGSTYEATVTAKYQHGYPGTGPFTLQAWVSHDDGTNWTSLGSQKTDKARKVDFDIRTPKDAKFVTLRVRATDANGTSIDQTIERAWKVNQK
jgi:subtilisin family serine protease